MIVKTKDGRRIFIAPGHLEAIVPDEAPPEIQEYYIQVAGERYEVDRETGDRILDEAEKREDEARREDEMDMEKKSMILSVIKKSAQVHTHDAQGNCIPLPPKADPGEWLRDFNEENPEPEKGSDL